MSINIKIDLSRYNYVELEHFLAEGIISVPEFEAEVQSRGISADTITPPDNEQRD